EQRAPTAQIVEIVADTRLHLVDPRRFAATPVDLREAREPGQNLVPQHVPLDQLAGLNVPRVWLRARPDQAHPAVQDVQELRHLVQRIAAQEVAYRRHPRVVFLDLNEIVAVLADGPRPKLVDDDFLAVQSVTALLEQHA